MPIGGNSQACIVINTMQRATTIALQRRQQPLHNDIKKTIPSVDIRLIRLQRSITRQWQLYNNWICFFFIFWPFFPSLFFTFFHLFYTWFGLSCVFSSWFCLFLVFSFRCWATNMAILGCLVVVSDHITFNDSEFSKRVVLFIHKKIITFFAFYAHVYYTFSESKDRS